MKAQISCFVCFFFFLLISVIWLCYRIEDSEFIEIKNIDLFCSKIKHFMYAKYVINTTRGIVEIGMFQHDCISRFNNTIEMIQNKWEYDYNIETMFFILIVAIFCSILPLFLIMRKIRNESIDKHLLGTNMINV